MSNGLAQSILQGDHTHGCQKSKKITRIFPILIDLQQSCKAFSMASPDLTIETPQLPF
jgi:hypothetical protein